MTPWRIAPRALGSLAILIAATVSARGTDPTSEPTIGHGRLLYRMHCLGCHGKDGSGGPPVSGHLESAPPDLTTLAARNEGRFPFETTVEVIDGRRHSPSHGTREMPVWGFSFQTIGADHNQEAAVREKITALTRYIQSIQETDP